MSYDLGVWHSTKRWSTADARIHYSKLCEGRPKKSLVEPNPKISKFVKELTSKYPNIDDVSDDEIDNSPWNCALDVTKSHCVMSISFSKASKVMTYVRRLAQKYELICYDPQKDRVQTPKNLSAAANEPAKYSAPAQVRIKVIKHTRPFNFKGVDTIELMLLDGPLKRLKTPIPFREPDVEIVEISVNPDSYTTDDGKIIDEIHLFKHAEKTLWKFTEFHCKDGVLRSLSDSGESIVPFE